MDENFLRAMRSGKQFAERGSTKRRITNASELLALPPSPVISRTANGPSPPIASSVKETVMISSRSVLNRVTSRSLDSFLWIYGNGLSKRLHVRRPQEPEYRRRARDYSPAIAISHVGGSVSGPTVKIDNVGATIPPDADRMNDAAVDSPGLKTSPQEPR